MYMRILTHIQVNDCNYTYIHNTYIHTYIDERLAGGGIKMNMYTHTYIHTYTHIHIHTYIHTYINTYTHTYIHIHIHT